MGADVVEGNPVSGTKGEREGGGSTDNGCVVVHFDVSEDRVGCPLGVIIEVELPGGGDVAGAPVEAFGKGRELCGVVSGTNCVKVVWGVWGAIDWSVECT